jgi:hypothetical protein
MPNVHEETVINGVPTSGSHSKHQFVSTLRHTWTLPEDGSPPGERSCRMNQNCHNQLTLSNESVKFLSNQLSLLQSEIPRVQQITTTKYLKPLIPYATWFQDRTSRITCCTVGGTLRWCWCQPFCKPSRTFDTSYTCNPSSSCLSIPFTCLGILLYFLPSGACFCFLYTLPFPHYSASDLGLPFLHGKHSVIPSSFGIVLT